MGRETLAQRILRLRTGLGISQDELSKRAGTTATHVWQLEKGKRKRLTEDSAERYARALEVSVPYLLYGFELVPAKPEDWPPLETFLRETAGLDDVQIATMRRQLQAFEAERELREIREQLRAQGIILHPHADPRQVAEQRKDYEAKAGEEEEEDRPQTEAERQSREAASNPYDDASRQSAQEGMPDIGADEP